MSGPKRNPDKLNTIGVVVVGICGAVLVYVTIIALQAFYMNDTSALDTEADYGGQDITAKSHKAEEMRNIEAPSSNQVANQVAPGMDTTYRISIDTAMKLVVRDAKADPSALVPGIRLKPDAANPASAKVFTSTKPTIEPIFGRPKPLMAPPPPAAPAAPAEGSAAPAGSAAGAGSAAATPAGSTTPAPAAGTTPAPAAATPGAAAPHPAAGSGSGH